MKSIKEKSDEYAMDYLFNPFPQRAPNEYFEAGANYVLEEIENFMKGLDKDLDFCSADEMFYKLDVIADIGLFIKQLKK